MITVGLLTIIFVGGLITGCTTHQKQYAGDDPKSMDKAFRLCPPPGHSNQTNGSCSYDLMVLKVDKANKKVTGVVPQRVVDSNRDSGKLTKKNYDLRGYPINNEYSFQVNDVTNIEEGKEFKFHSLPNKNDQTFNNILIKGKAPCLAPDQPAYQKCGYTLKIDSINREKDMVTAMVPQSVIDAYRESGGKMGMKNKDLDDYNLKKKYTFHVESLAGIRKGGIYKFISLPVWGDKKVGALRLLKD